MSHQIYIDPALDMVSDRMVTVIIQFKTQPAQVAVKQAENSSTPITLEKARQEVENSHKRFKEDLNKYFISQRIPFAITHTYKEVLNGVALQLPANKIRLLLSFQEIASIHANKEYHIDPPIQYM